MTIPRELRQYLSRLARPAWMGNLRTTTPLSFDWGYDRGRPIDRYYIEAFLAMYRSDIRGRVLEVKDSTYSRHFDSGVTVFDVLDIDKANPIATVVADLASAATIGADQFDCFILTQTLHLIYDTRAAIAHAHRMLSPGGTLLVTVPAVSRITYGYQQREYWRFTTASCAEIFGSIFGAQNIRVVSYGNVLAAIGFLTGMACEDLTTRELETVDEYYPVVIGVWARKPPNHE